MNNQSCPKCGNLILKSFSEGGTVNVFLRTSYNGTTPLSVPPENEITVGCPKCLLNPAIKIQGGTIIQNEIILNT